MASHLPRGQRSVAMRSFAQVEHPHLRHRPVALRAAASHSGQALHVDSRLARISGGVVEKPARAKRCADTPNLDIISKCNFKRRADIYVNAIVTFEMCVPNETGIEQNPRDDIDPPNIVADELSAKLSMKDGGLSDVMFGSYSASLAK